MTIVKLALYAGLTALALALPLAPQSHAQGAKSDAKTDAKGDAKTDTKGDTGVPNALQGFSQNRDKPVNIEAASLEVRDKDKVAIFAGNVVVVQGDTNLRCKTLKVFYDQEDGKDSKGTSMKAAKPGPGGKQSIKRLEALGGVVVTQKDQVATGETGIFDMKSNTITLSGGVSVIQGKNVLRGERLVVDVASGAARVESGKGRVQGLFITNSDDKDKKDDKKSDKKSGAASGDADTKKPRKLF